MDISEELLIGVAQVYYLSTFLGVALGLLVIIFAMIFKSKRGGVYNESART